MSGKNYEEKFDKLRKKFNMAEEAVEEMTEDLEELEIDTLGEPGQHLPAEPVEAGQLHLQPVFTIEALKQDFLMVRQNVLSVITKGQNILDQVGILEIGDMKGSQLMALATLQKTLGENVKLLMDIYKDIVAIEKDKAEMEQMRNSMTPSYPAMNVKGDVHQQIVVAGSTSDLLAAIKRNEPKDVTPEEK